MSLFSFSKDNNNNQSLWQATQPDKKPTFGRSTYPLPPPTKQIIYQKGTDIERRYRGKTHFMRSMWAAIYIPVVLCGTFLVFKLFDKWIEKRSEQKRTKELQEYVNKGQHMRKNTSFENEQLISGKITRRVRGGSGRLLGADTQESQNPYEEVVYHSNEEAQVDEHDFGELKEHSDQLLLDYKVNDKDLSDIKKKIKDHYRGNPGFTGILPLMAMHHYRYSNAYRDKDWDIICHVTNNFCKQRSLMCRLNEHLNGMKLFSDQKDKNGATIPVPQYKEKMNMTKIMDHAKAIFPVPSSFNNDLELLHIFIGMGIIHNTDIHYAWAVLLDKITWNFSQFYKNQSNVRTGIDPTLFLIEYYPGYMATKMHFSSHNIVSGVTRARTYRTNRRTFLNELNTKYENITVANELVENKQNINDRANEQDDVKRQYSPSQTNFISWLQLWRYRAHVVHNKMEKLDKLIYDSWKFVFRLWKEQQQNNAFSNLFSNDETIKVIHATETLLIYLTLAYRTTLLTTPFENKVGGSGASGDQKKKKKSNLKKSKIVSDFLPPHVLNEQANNVLTRDPKMSIFENTCFLTHASGSWFDPRDGDGPSKSYADKNVSIVLDNNRVFRLSDDNGPNNTFYDRRSSRSSRDIPHNQEVKKVKKKRQTENTAKMWREKNYKTSLVTQPEKDRHQIQRYEPGHSSLFLNSAKH